MLDIRNTGASVHLKLQGMQADRAMQCPSRDPQTGDFYTSQAHVNGRHEDCWIYQHDAGGNKLHLMKLVLGGHGTTISTLRRGGVVGVVVNWSGHGLVWVPYRGGEFTWEQSKAVSLWRPQASGNRTAYIDHDHSIVSIRKKSGPLHTFRLYTLNDDGTLGDTIGRTIGPRPGNEGRYAPYQGQFVAGSLLFQLFGYGHHGQKQYARVWDYNTGQQLYVANLRRLGANWRVQEPESGLVIDGVPHLGIAGREGKSNVRQQLLVKLPQTGAVVDPRGTWVVTKQLRATNYRTKKWRTRRVGFKVTTGDRVVNGKLRTKRGYEYPLGSIKKVKR